MPEKKKKAPVTSISYNVVQWIKIHHTTYRATKQENQGIL
jgi:hypothetical protein